MVVMAGIVLLVLLYILNLTVTNGTINGIIFYARFKVVSHYWMYFNTITYYWIVVQIMFRSMFSPSVFFN